MGYTKQIFEVNQVLTAEELNLMDNQIYANDIAIESLKTSKQDRLEPGINIKTINNQSILGSGNITIEGRPSTVEKTTEEEITAMGFTKNKGTVTAITLNGNTFNPSNGVVNLGTISGGSGDSSNSLPLTGGTLTGGLIAPSIYSNNILFNDNDPNEPVNTTGNNYINFLPAGSTINRGCKTFYRFVFANGNMTDSDVKSKLHGLTIGPAMHSNIGANATIGDFDMHIDISRDNTPYTPYIHIGNAEKENVWLYGMASKAKKVVHPLTITSGSTTITYDGSAAKSITVSGGSNIDTSNLATKSELNAKQDIISDLSTIRTGASKGATAIQSVKTINGVSILGSGNINISGGSGNTSLFDVANTHISIRLNAPTGTVFDSNTPTNAGSGGSIGDTKFIYKMRTPGTVYFANISIIPHSDTIKIIPAGDISDKKFTVTYNTTKSKFVYDLSLEIPAAQKAVITGAPTPGTDPFLDSELIEFKALVRDGETIKTVDACLPLYFNA